MSDRNQLELKRSFEEAVPILQEIDHTANDLCEKVLVDARGQLHPLMQRSELHRLDQRVEFIRALKTGLEQRIARRLAAWHPNVQAVFKYEGTPTQSVEHWDGSIHLLLKVPCLSETVKIIGEALDRALVNSLQQLGLPRFRECQTILDVQQVTPTELRHSIGYGAMFCAVYTAPVKVWPPDGCARLTFLSANQHRS